MEVLSLFSTQFFPSRFPLLCKRHCQGPGGIQCFSNIVQYLPNTFITILYNIYQSLLQYCPIFAGYFSSVSFFPFFISGHRPGPQEDGGQHKHWEDCFEDVMLISSCQIKRHNSSTQCIFKTFHKNFWNLGKTSKSSSFSPKLQSMFQRCKDQPHVERTKHNKGRVA